MNYLDLLPNDVMKIINRKVEDLHIISRKKERKENKKINMEQKRIADYKEVFIINMFYYTRNILEILN